MFILEEILSEELKVALKVFEYDKKKNEPIYLNKLDEVINDVSKNKISSSVDELFDLGIINAKWEKSGGNWARVLTISGEAEDFLEDLDERVKELEE